MKKIWEPVLFLSDCHLSDGSAGDDFLPRSQRFMDMLDWAKQEKIDSVVTVGDFLDCWEATADQIRKKYDYIFERLFDFRWRYICGNHDPFPLVVPAFYEILERPRWLKISVHRDRLIIPRIPGDSPISRFLPLLAMHGHQFDRNISRWPKLAGAVAVAGGFFERRGFPNVDKRFSKIESWISGVGRHNKNGDMDNKFIDYAYQDYGIGIAGHTHNGVCYSRYYNQNVADIKEGIVLDGDLFFRHLYFNTGSWTNKDRPCPGVVVREDVIQIIESREDKIETIGEIDLQDFRITVGEAGPLDKHFEI